MNSSEIGNRDYREKGARKQKPISLHAWCLNMLTSEDADTNLLDITMPKSNVGDWSKITGKTVCLLHQIPIDLLSKVMSLLHGPSLFLCIQSARRFQETQNHVSFWTASLQSEFGILVCVSAVDGWSVSACKQVYRQTFMWHDAMDTFQLLQRLGVPGDIDSDVIVDGTRLDIVVLRALLYTAALTAPDAADLGAPQLRKLRAASMLPLAVLVHSQRRDLRDSAAAALANVVARGAPLAQAKALF